MKKIAWIKTFQNASYFFLRDNFFCINFLLDFSSTLKLSSTGEKHKMGDKPSISNSFTDTSALGGVYDTSSWL